jgi:hypothetical protein
MVDNGTQRWKNWTEMNDENEMDERERKMEERKRKMNEA